MNETRNEPTRRRQILRAAERLLRSYGPAKTTIADIAREADISVGSVYLEFSSKDAIVEELSALRYKAVLEAMREAAELSSRPYRERLRAMLDSRVEAFLRAVDEGAHACDLLHCKSEAVKSARDRFLEGERALIAALLQSGVRAGELEVARPEATATAILSAYMSFSPPWLFGVPRDELGGRLRALHDVILYGIVRRVPIDDRRT